MLETYTLKQQNNSLRQELSVALYMQDAATRVVARLIRERDAARECVAPPFYYVSNTHRLMPQSSRKRVCNYGCCTGRQRRWRRRDDRSR